MEASRNNELKRVDDCQLDIAHQMNQLNNEVASLEEKIEAEMQRNSNVKADLCACIEVGFSLDKTLKSNLIHLIPRNCKRKWPS